MLRRIAIMLLRSKMVRSKTFTGVDGPYLTIYTVLRIRSLSLCVHHFHRSDEDPDCHCHPFNYFSFIVSGSYEEFLIDGGSIIRRQFSSAYRQATHKHRVQLLSATCWTICVKHDVDRQWGFWPDNQYIHWEEYLRSKGLEPLT